MPWNTLLSCSLLIKIIKNCKYLSARFSFQVLTCLCYKFKVRIIFPLTTVLRLEQTVIRRSLMIITIKQHHHMEQIAVSWTKTLMSVLFSQKVNFLTKLCKLPTSPTPLVSSIDTNNSRLCSVSWHPLIQDQEGGGCIHFSLSFLSFMCLLSELKFVKNTAPGTTRNFLWNFSMIPVSSPNVSTQYCLKLTGNGSLVSKS